MRRDLDYKHDTIWLSYKDALFLHFVETRLGDSAKIYFKCSQYILAISQLSTLGNECDPSS